MLPHRISREVVGEPLECEACDGLFIPSWPSFGCCEEYKGFNDSTTASAVRFVSHGNPPDESGLPSQSPFIWSVMNGGNKHAGNRSSFRNDANWSPPWSTVGESYINGNFRYEPALLSDNIDIQPFQNLKKEDNQPNIDDGTFFQDDIKPNQDQNQWDDPMIHAYLCRFEHCTTVCTQLRRLFFHVRSCEKRRNGEDCETCQWTGFLLQMHAQVCQSQECPLPCCQLSSISSQRILNFFPFDVGLGKEHKEAQLQGFFKLVIWNGCIMFGKC